jgi:hypothetical protein
MERPRSTTLGVASTLLLGWTLAAAQAPTAPPKPATKPATKPAAKAQAEPKVLSAEESARRSRGSEFLGGTETGRYGEGVPFSELPPWKQTSFYGIRAKAQTVVFVVDCSESMADASSLVRAKRELRRSIAGLQFPQKFAVIFYNDEPIPMPGVILKSADVGAKDQLTNWLRLIEPDGGTDPRAAIRMAIGMNPDVIYLLSDGLFPDGTSEDVATRNRRKIPIQCIDLSGGIGGDHLKRIATDSGGQYAARSR